MSATEQMKSILILRKFMKRNPVMNFKNTVFFDLHWAKISRFNREKLIKEFFPREWSESRGR